MSADKPLSTRRFADLLKVLNSLAADGTEAHLQIYETGKALLAEHHRARKLSDALHKAELGVKEFLERGSVVKLDDVLRDLAAARRNLKSK